MNFSIAISDGYIFASVRFETSISGHLLRSRDSLAPPNSFFCNNRTYQDFLLTSRHGDVLNDPRQHHVDTNRIA